jgi:hypothetical protein
MAERQEVVGRQPGGSIEIVAVVGRRRTRVSAQATDRGRVGQHQSDATRHRARFSGNVAGGSSNCQLHFACAGTESWLRED